MTRPIEQRLAITELALLGLTVLAWLSFTDRTSESLRTTLFFVGLGSIILGILFVCGAWRGVRDVDVDYIMGPSPERSARAFQDIRRAYSDLNVLALAGCIAIILSALI